MSKTKQKNGQVKEKAPLLKVVLLGNGGVGKSCLMNRYVNNKFDKDSFHTIGVEFLTKDLDHDEKSYCLQIWDTAGQERFKSLRTPFYRGADICILTYSIADRESFDNLTMWKNEFLQYANVSDPEGFPFLVFGNKCDVPLEEKKVPTEEAEMWCKENGYPFIETSAKESTNVERAFQLSLQNWLKNESRMEKPCMAPTVNLNNVNQEKVTCC